ncbi:MAG: hypothetical protein KatS3mg057_2628 [Herpetosiphonaceae bacterium]|nr:MAG: hypothetical protein KatS3mg057_2628 [Herpetosiphonaceae bacterium]
MKKQERVTIIGAGIVGLLLIVALSLGIIRSGRAEEQQPILKMPDFPPTPTIGTAPAQPSQSEGDPLLSANFETSDALEDWEFVDLDLIHPQERALWKIKDGQLIQDRTAAAGNPSEHQVAAIIGDPGWTNYAITAQVYDIKNMSFGLIARYNGDSYYRFRIFAEPYQANPAGVLEKVVDGVAVPLAEVHGDGYQQRTWHTVKMSVSGSQIQVWLEWAACRTG